MESPPRSPNNVFDFPEEEIENELEEDPEMEEEPEEDPVMDEEFN